MPYLAWKDSMSVNVPELDEQHRRLIEVANDLHATLLEGELKAVLQARGRALHGLEQYLEEHFTAEERHMEKIGYPDLAAHRARHQEFREQVQHFRKRLHDGDLVLSTEIMKTLMAWIQDHLIAEDGKYRDFSS